MIIALWAVAASAAAPAGELGIGWGGDPTQGYGFVTFAPALGRHDDASVTLATSVSYLNYQISYPGVLIGVTSPGASIGPGFKFAVDDFSFGLGVGFEVRYETRTDQLVAKAPITHGWDIGAALSGNLYWWPGQRRFAAYGTASFSGANAYIWTRAGVKFQVVPLFKRGTQAALWLGLDGTARGNRDTRALEGGLVAEVPIRDIHASFQVRAGPVAAESRDPVTDSWGPPGLMLSVGAGAYWFY